MISSNQPASDSEIVRTVGKGEIDSVILNCWCFRHLRQWARLPLLPFVLRNPLLDLGLLFFLFCSLSLPSATRKINGNYYTGERTPPGTRLSWPQYCSNDRLTWSRNPYQTLCHRHSTIRGIPSKYKLTSPLVSRMWIVESGFGCDVTVTDIKKIRAPKR